MAIFQKWGLLGVLLEGLLRLVALFQGLGYLVDKQPFFWVPSKPNVWTLFGFTHLSPWSREESGFAQSKCKTTNNSTQTERHHKHREQNTRSAPKQNPQHANKEHLKEILQRTTSSSHTCMHSTTIMNHLAYAKSATQIILIQTNCSARNKLKQFDKMTDISVLCLLWLLMPETAEENKDWGIWKVQLFWTTETMTDAKTDQWAKMLICVWVWKECLLQGKIKNKGTLSAELKAKLYILL